MCASLKAISSNDPQLSAKEGTLSLSGLCKHIDTVSHTQITVIHIYAAAMATCLHHPKKIGEGRKYKHKQRKREAHAQRVAPRSNLEEIVVLCTIKLGPKDVKSAAPPAPSSLRGEQSERFGSCTAL